MRLRPRPRTSSSTCQRIHKFNASYPCGAAPESASGKPQLLLDLFQNFRLLFQLILHTKSNTPQTQFPELPSLFPHTHKNLPKSLQHQLLDLLPTNQLIFSIIPDDQAWTKKQSNPLIVWEDSESPWRTQCGAPAAHLVPSVLVHVF